MSVLICGSRDWKDAEAIGERLDRLPPSTVVIHGGAPGADQIAGRLATERGMHSAVVTAQWRRYGKRAGYLRNVAMLDLTPDLVIAFSNGSKGTQLTIYEARKRGIHVEVVGRERQ